MKTSLKDTGIRLDHVQPIVTHETTDSSVIPHSAQWA